MTRCDYCSTFSGTDEERWRQQFGTEFYGNLPKNKKREVEVDGIIYSRVGKLFAPCPYSTQSTNVQTATMLGLEIDYASYNSDYKDYWGTAPSARTGDPPDIEDYVLNLPTKTDHVVSGTGQNDRVYYYMYTEARGSHWGYSCHFPNCPYVTVYSGTTPYFHN
jgi:hypothetical protein